MPSAPKASDSDVRRLIRINSLSGEPVRLAYQDFGYQPRMCHLSAKHHAILNGGQRVHGWAIWRWPVPGAPLGETILFAEHHSVWRRPDGTLVDVTPPPVGCSEILFLRDDSADIKLVGAVFKIRTDLTDDPNIPRVLAGAPCSAEFWDLPATKADAVEYATAIGFDIQRTATEPGIG